MAAAAVGPPAPARRADGLAVWLIVALALAAAGALAAQEPRHAVDAALVLAGVAAFAWRPFLVLLVILVAAYKDSPLVLLLTVATGPVILLVRARSVPAWAIRLPFLALLLFAIWRLPVHPSLDEDLNRLTIPGLGTEYLPPLSDELIGWVRVAFLLVAFWLSAWLVRDPQRLRGVVVAILVGALPPVFIGLKEIATGDYGHRDGFDVINGPFPFANYFAFYLLAVVLLALVVLLETRVLRWRLTVAGLFGGALVCLFFTYTRSAWLALAAGFLVIALLRERKLIFIGAAVLAITVFAFPQSIDRVERRFSNLSGPSGVETNSWTWRTHQWKRMVHYGYDHPVSGNGFGSYARLTVREFGTQGKEFSTLATTNDGRRVARGFTAHNDFVRMLVELGIPGLLLWCTTLLALLVTALRARRIPGVGAYAVGAAGMVVAVIMMSSTDNLMGYTAALLVPMVLVGAVAGAASAARRGG